MTPTKIDIKKVAVAAINEVAGEAAAQDQTVAAVVQLFNIVKMLHENPHQKLSDHTSHPDFIGSALHGLLGL